jgi:hypothetical protein
MTRALDHPRVDASMLGDRDRAKASAQRTTVIVGERQRISGGFVDQSIEDVPR